MDSIIAVADTSMHVIFSSGGSHAGLISAMVEDAKGAEAEAATAVMVNTHQELTFSVALTKN
jgi:hypothetical protein